MVGFDHGPNRAEVPDPATDDRHARSGRALFAIYLVLYGGFVGLIAFAPRLMERTPVAGVSLAILYGFGLIAAALLLALLYGWLCRRSGTADAGERRP